jgi:putative ABC transport system permease protein
VWTVLFLGVVALILAMMGIYGVVAFAVGRRTREMGIRTALGATRRDIVALVLVSSAKPVLAGAAVGLVAAAFAAQALGRLFRNAPVPVDPRDPSTYAAATAILLLVATIAMLGPARRAAASEPVRALRQD